MMQVLKQLLKPSTLIVIVWLYVFVLGLIGCYYALLTQSPEVRQYIDYRQSIPVETPVWYESISSSVNRSKFAADIAVFAVWALVGVLLYAVAEIIFRFIVRTWEFEHELVSTLTNRTQLISNTAAGAGLLLLGIVIFIVTFFVLVPLSVSFGTSHITSLQSSPQDMAVFVTVFFLLSALITYLAGLSLRLILRKIRVF